MARFSLTAVAMGLVIALMVLPSTATFASCSGIPLGQQKESCRKAEQNMMKPFREDFAGARIGKGKKLSSREYFSLPVVPKSLKFSYSNVRIHSYSRVDLHVFARCVLA